MDGRFGVFIAGDFGGLPNFWWRGGFPLSALAHTDSDSVLWRENFIRDFLEREYSYQTTIRVLTPQTFVQTIVAPIAAALPLHCMEAIEIKITS